MTDSSDLEPNRGRPPWSVDRFAHAADRPATTSACCTPADARHAPSRRSAEPMCGPLESPDPPRGSTQSRRKSSSDTRAGQDPDRSDGAHGRDAEIREQAIASLEPAMRNEPADRHCSRSPPPARTCRPRTFAAFPPAHASHSTSRSCVPTRSYPICTSARRETSCTRSPNKLRRSRPPSTPNELLDRFTATAPDFASQVRRARGT